MRRVLQLLPKTLHTAWRRRGLRQQLFVLFIVFSLGPLLITNVVGYMRTRAAMTQAGLRDLSNVVALQASQTWQFVQDRHRLTRSFIAGNLHLFGLVQSMNRMRDPTSRQRLARSLQAHLAAAADAQRALEFSILSGSGRLVASSRGGRRAGVGRVSDGCYRQGRESLGVAGFEYGADKMTLIVAGPIHGGDGRRLGIVCARFSFDIHRELVAAEQKRTKGASFYLLDEHRRVISTSASNVRQSPLGQQIRLRRHGLVGGTRAWRDTFETDSGEETFAAFAPIPHLNWGVFAQIPATKALSALHDLATRALWLSIPLALGLALAVYLLAKTLARPLKALGLAAQRTAGGALGESVPVSGPRELEDLGRAFNQMSLALKDSHDLLGRRIQERTAELQRSQEFAELLINSLDLRIIVVDQSLRILKANRAALYMHGPHLVGKHCHEVFDCQPTDEPDNESCSHCPATAAFRRGLPETAERPQRTANGQEIVQVECFPIRSATGDIEAVVEIARVVTQERRREAQMIHQEKMAAFGLLAAGFAHEIGNPLASIASQLRMLREFPEPERLERTLEVVEREVQRMDGLLREMVRFARRRRDEVTLVSLGQVAQDVVRLLRHDPRARSVRFEGHENLDLPGVRGREDHIVQVLLNLGINALDAMPDGGSLTFEPSLSNGMVGIRIRDTGYGISPETHAELFEPFFTTKAPEAGTGLGLFVSRSLVEAMGGHLQLETSGSEGSAFLMMFPRGDSSGPKAAGVGGEAT